MRPIAGANQYPYGLNGVSAFTARDVNSVSLTGLRILKQSSGRRFSLQTADGSVVYNKIMLIASDADGIPFTASTPPATVLASTGPAQFTIQVFSNGSLLGYARKITKHRIVLGDGSVYTGIDIGSSSTGIAVTSVSVQSATASISVGATSQIVPTVLPANATDKSLTYTSSAPAIATVSASGLITGVAPGTAAINVRNLASNISSTVNTTVNAIMVTAITLGASTATVNVGATSQITSTVTPANATDKSLTYTSSAPAVATVSATGLITGVAAGSSTVTVKNAASNVSSNVAVTVPPVLVTAINVGSSTVNLAVGGTNQITVGVVPANATDKTIVYSSSATGVATVTAGGLITAVATGTATITLKNNASNVTKTITVTVA